jgi:uncharacterized protein (AIM24 family)
VTVAPDVELPKPSPAAGPEDEGRFLAHLRRAGELAGGAGAGGQRLPEAELELLRALTVRPRDLRALELLALVRFKLGRLADAREVYREAVALAPGNASAHLNLGLIALKHDWPEEAVAELEEATRLAPGDRRAWSYLGYAHARAGAAAPAVAAFRRAGQPALAAEIESSLGGRPVAGAFRLELARAEAAPGSVAAPAPNGTAGGGGGGGAPGGRVTVTSLAGFATSCLLPGAQDGDDDVAAEGEAMPDDVLKLRVEGEAHVRHDALLASVGDLRVDEAHRRRHGRVTEEGLGQPGRPFVRCTGVGEVWLTVPRRGRGLVALSLEQDVLYLREERVAAFDGDVVWESGQVPWDGMPLLQFRGSGRVVVDAAGGEVLALRVPEGETVTVSRPRLIGWVGRIVAQSVRPQPGGGGGNDPLAHIACEGEGVLLLSRHGQSSQSVHERPEPGDHGARPADPGRPLLHR